MTIDPRTSAERIPRRDGSPPRARMMGAAISADAKLAWIVLWDLAGCRPAHLAVHVATLGRYLGRTERSAQRWLATLDQLGVIEIDRREAGRTWLSVIDPEDAPQLAVVRPTDPRQIRLPFADPDPGLAAPILQLAHPDPDPPRTCGDTCDDTTAGPPELTQPQAPAGNVTTAAPMATRPPHEPIDGLQSKPMPHNSPGALPTSPSAGPAPIQSALVAAVDRLADSRTPEQRLVQLQARVAGTVGDPGTNPAVYRQAAAAVVYRDLDPELLDQVLEDVRRKRGDGTLRSPGAYFTVRIRSAMERDGIPWTSGGPPR